MGVYIPVAEFVEADRSIFKTYENDSIGSQREDVDVMYKHMYISGVYSYRVTCIVKHAGVTTVL